MQRFDPKEFVDRQVMEIRRTVGSEKALIAVSGGVDSSTCAALTHRALKENLLCVMLDDAFMRIGEPERVRELLAQPPINLPLRILRVQKRFLKALKGLHDAEEKRKAFRETFYRSLSETAEMESCRFLVQGTIQADIVETIGGIKTQHNVLSQVGINPTEYYGFQVIEPLVTLYKGQVRKVARFLGIPSQLSERQPFPGPGLSVRVVGEIRADKLEVLKKATALAEETLAKHQPDQYFAAIIDNTEATEHPKLSCVRETAAEFLKIPSERIFVKAFRNRATGIKGEGRHYGEIVAVEAHAADSSIHQPSISSLVALQTEILRKNPSFTRVLYGVQEKQQKQPYVIAIRAIQTHDFITAEVSDIPWTTLTRTAQRIFQACPNVSDVYYDITPKPPATIEME
ncbi:MAG: GMP synthase [Candidatus Bathyarchaeota archaeon]|nr:MAG: GMP synthase [Candidatus Bathyarchaeota archaeon]